MTQTSSEMNQTFSEMSRTSSEKLHDAAYRIHNESQVLARIKADSVRYRFDETNKLFVVSTGWVQIEIKIKDLNQLYLLCQARTLIVTEYTLLRRGFKCLQKRIAFISQYNNNKLNSKVILTPTKPGIEEFNDVSLACLYHSCKPICKINVNKYLEEFVSEYEEYVKDNEVDSVVRGGLNATLYTIWPPLCEKNGEI